MTDDPELLAYVSGLPLLDDRWGVEAIIGYLIGAAKYPTPGDPNIRTVLHAKLADPDGELKPVSFELRMTHADGTRRLEIELLP